MKLVQNNFFLEVEKYKKREVVFSHTLIFKINNTLVKLYNGINFDNLKEVFYIFKYDGVWWKTYTRLEGEYSSDRKPIAELVGCSFENIKDKNCCSVVALALACDVPFREAQFLLECAGRQYKKAILTVQMYDLLKEVCFGKKFTEIPFQGTVGCFIKQNNGAFLVFVKGHVFFMKDKKIFDYTLGLKRKVQKIFKVDLAQNSV